MIPTVSSIFHERIARDISKQCQFDAKPSSGLRTELTWDSVAFNSVEVPRDLGSN